MLRLVVLMFLNLIYIKGRIVVILYNVLAVAWTVLGVVSNDTAAFACSIGCLIYAKLCEKEKE